MNWRYLEKCVLASVTFLVIAALPSRDTRESEVRHPPENQKDLQSLEPGFVCNLHGSMNISIRGVIVDGTTDPIRNASILHIVNPGVKDEAVLAKATTDEEGRFTMPIELSWGDTLYNGTDHIREIEVIGYPGSFNLRVQHGDFGPVDWSFGPFGEKLPIGIDGTVDLGRLRVIPNQDEYNDE